MKKLVCLVLTIVMCCALTITSFAVDIDFTVPKEVVLHASYDEIRPGIACGTDSAKINTPVLASGTKEASFWGWIATTKEIANFSYSVNNGEKVTDASFTVAPEQGVIDAAAGHGATHSSRFLVKVPVAEGTQLVKVFANFADGTSELYWVAELTVGTATEYDPNSGTNGAGGSGDTEGEKDAIYEENGMTIINVSKLPAAGAFAGYTKLCLNYQNGAANAAFSHSIGTIDLSKYKTLTIYYGTDGSAVANGVGDALLQKADGTELKRITLAGAESWAADKTATFDLSDIDYNGEVLLVADQGIVNGFCVTKIALEPAEQTDNTPTGDISMIFVVAAVAVVLTVVSKKKIFA